METKKSKQHSPAPADVPDMNDENVTDRAWVKWIDFDNGFFKGQRIPLKPGYNVLGGGQGVGKTLIVETLRWMLTEAELVGETKRHLSITLKNTNVRMGIVSDFGKEFIVSRKWGDSAPRVTDLDGGAVEITARQLIQLDAFSHNAMQAIAKDEASQLALIDNFAPKELRPIEDDIVRVLEDLATNATRLGKLVSEVDTLDTAARDAAVLEEKLKAAESREFGPDAALMSAAYANRALRQREAAAYVTAREMLPSTLKDMSEAATKARRALSTVVGDDVLTGPNRTNLRALHDELAKVGGEYESIIARLRTASEGALANMVVRERELASLHAPQELTYESTIAKSNEESERAAERAELQRQLLEAVEARKKQRERLDEKTTAEDQRRVLMSTLSGLRERRFAVRDRVAKEISASLAPNVEVTVLHAAGDAAYRAALSEALSSPEEAKSKLKQNVAADKIVEKLTAEELVRVVGQGDHVALARKASIGEEVARKVVARLTSDPLVTYKLEVTESADVPTIKLRLAGSEKFKPSLDLSTGQRASSILPILLLKDKNPVVFDQPEDNLGSRYRAGVVVKALQMVTPKRQIFFMTHDATLVVFPGMAWVVCLEAAADCGVVEKYGWAKGLGKEIEDRFDGGAEAFGARMVSYGYRPDADDDDDKK